MLIVFFIKSYTILFFYQIYTVRRAVLDGFIHLGLGIGEKLGNFYKAGLIIPENIRAYFHTDFAEYALAKVNIRYFHGSYLLTAWPIFLPNSMQALRSS